MRGSAKQRAWKHDSAKHCHSAASLLASAYKSTAMPAEAPRNERWAAQVTAAKAALDAARLMGDKLREDLAESTLNSLLDRYHTYYTSQRRNDD